MPNCPVCGGELLHVHGAGRPHHGKIIWPDRFLLPCGFICRDDCMIEGHSVRLPCPESRDLPVTHAVGATPWQSPHGLG
jgi:hypothetical protein